MSDPRFTDPRNSDPRLSDPVLRRDESVGGIWGWVAGLAVVALIAFVVIAGWNNSGGNTANNGPNPAPITTGSAPMSPPSTTGSGATSPSMPSGPAPSTPSPAPRNGQ